MKSLRLIALLVVCLSGSVSASPQDDAKIADVENGLGAAVIVSGQPRKTRTIAESMEAMNVAGVSIAVIREGQIVWAKGYGVTERRGPPVTPQTRFQAGSISKSVSALGLLRLASTGAVSLDASVNDYLVDWKLPDESEGKASEVTLRRLLSHSAGIGVRGFPGYPKGTPTPGLVDILDGTPPANTPAIRIVAKPGEAYSYSGGGYVIAQRVVEDVAHRRFSQWAKKELLMPSGMTASSFEPKPERPYAQGHDNAGAPVPGGYHLYPESAAAGLWTTPSDLARAMLLLSSSLSGEPNALLSREMAQAAIRPAPPGQALGFNAGGEQDARWIAKGGDTEGFAAYMVFYPAQGDGAVVMTNAAQGSTLARDVIRAIAVAYDWPDFGPRVRESAPYEPWMLERLPGTYVYRETQSFTITRSGQSLMIESPGADAEALYLDPEGAFFTLSQDIDFIFEDGAATGYIKIGNDRLPFRKSPE